jgi:5-oxoprolinase (ATP-hydrolysing)
VIREMEFLQPIEISLLTERRARQPYGLADGQSGLNIHVRLTKDSDGKPVRRERNLRGEATVAFEANDRLVPNTPGGGGWGVPGEVIEVQPERFGWQPRGSLAERSVLEADFGA